MENLVFTQLSVPEVRELFRQELHRYFNENTLLSKQKDEDKDPLDIKAASKILKKAVPTIYMLVEKGELPHCKKGNRLYFFKHELLEWVEKGRKATDVALQEEALTNFQNQNKKR